MDKESIIEILKTIEDPELRLDVWTLGLIREINIRTKEIYIKMTFTSPMCPFGEVLMDEIKSKVGKLLPVVLELSFEPPWQPTEELKEVLGIGF